MSADSGDRPPLSPEPQVDPLVLLRGPRYEAYSELRESRLRNKYRGLNRMGEEIGPVPLLATPPRKQVKFLNLSTTQVSDSMKDVKVPSSVGPGRFRGRKASSMAAQSVPDFSAALRKENRRPAPVVTLTPPPKKKGSPGMGNGLSAKGSKSASAVEKRGGGIAAARKSYVSLEELRGSSVRAANAICGGAGESGRRILGSKRL
ncbi:hypothetical protein MLD38_022789 [Melastoma candidum]|uniref:Uncharacterized protein n=1 Tax=Melastoma candidum TaxID=119954 RepID=A0ACB9QKE1_9MYRT|nr:hypothetical protein MLD38_022789 [Melastoma candidum]